MDQYGIGTAIEAYHHSLSQAARATGRTTAMINNLKPGDHVVFSNEREAERVFNICRDRGTLIRINIIDPRFPEILLRRVAPEDRERCVFDHSWVEEFYLNELQHAQKFFNNFEAKEPQNGPTCKGNPLFIR